jgi:hypothetical protein
MKITHVTIRIGITHVTFGVGITHFIFGITHVIFGIRITRVIFGITHVVFGIGSTRVIFGITHVIFGIKTLQPAGLAVNIQCGPVVVALCIISSQAHILLGATTGTSSFLSLLILAASDSK